MDSVYGELTIERNEFIETITGFVELDSVGGSLRIGGFVSGGNAALTSIPTFSALTHIEGSLLIHNNASLTTVSGFEALTNIGDELFIDNAALETITGFAALDNVGSSLRIGDVFASGNPALTSIPTFSALESVGDDLSIENNGALTTISGFEALTNIEGAFEIQNNGALTTISGFDMLTRVMRRLDITDNAKLTTISGFTALTSISDLTVQNNAALSSCCGLLRFVDIPPGGSRGISNNAAGCNSADEIKADCSTGPPPPPPPTTPTTTMLIDDDSDIPSNVATITTISGNLSISGTITSFPNFAALEVVEGDLTISDITTATLTALPDIFPALDSVRGGLLIQNQSVVQRITGFVELDSVGGELRIGAVPFGDEGNAALTSIPSFNALQRYWGESFY